MSKSEFANFIFGKASQPQSLIDNYFKDWQSSGYDVHLYKALLCTRG